jgi:hypothetical protein
MKTLLAILLVTLCAATSYGQTMKALAFNTTNGVVAYSGTNPLFFTNQTTFSGGINSSDLSADNLTVEGAIYFTDVLTNVSVTRSNLGLPLAALTNNNVTNFRTAIGLGTTNTVTFSNVVILGNVSTTNVISTATNFNVGGTLNVTNKAETRTNLGLPLPALTNTSNVTMMRALAGSTNTNEPYSGIIQYADGPDGDTYEMTVSNGIILKIEMQ